jgi:predicted glycoside hydrolase/deacetylase ChbG (UPF0249 family)
MPTSHSKTSKRLIVNADDYGLTRSVSAGIRQAHLNGAVTSTTALMNMPGVEDDLQIAIAECPKLGLGVHLVLTSGQPLLPPQQVSSLLPLFRDSDLSRWKDRIDSVRSLKASEIKAEWRAQNEKFVRATGRAPDHLDSHHHIAYLTRELSSALIELAREYRCAIRMPYTDGATTVDLYGDDIPVDLIERSDRYVLPMLANSIDLPRPDHFEARFYDQDATREVLHDIIAHLPDGVSEMMCHPAVPDSDLCVISVYNVPRGNERALLADPKLRSLIRSSNVELITFGDIARTHWKQGR